MVTTSYQYPQYLYALVVEDAKQTSNGSWEGAEPTYKLVAACREETNGKGSTINTADGKALIFSSLVQLPKGSPRIDEGVEVVIARTQQNAEDLAKPDYIADAKRSGDIVATGVNQKFDLGRLHSRMWI